MDSVTLAALEGVSTAALLAILLLARASWRKEREALQGQLSEAIARATDDRYEWAADLFDSAPIGVAKLALDGRWLQVNREVERMLEYTSAELTSGMTWMDVTTEETLADDERNVQAVLRGEQRSYRYEKAYNRKHGGVVQAKIWVTLSRSHGEAVWAVFIEDVTRAAAQGSEHDEALRLLRERLEQREEQVEELRAHVVELSGAKASEALAQARVARSLRAPGEA